MGGKNFFFKFFLLPCSSFFCTSRAKKFYFWHIQLLFYTSFDDSFALLPHQSLANSFSFIFGISSYFFIPLLTIVLPFYHINHLQIHSVLFLAYPVTFLYLF